MWFLRDASGDKVSEFFPSQAKLAVHMQMTPQSLQKAVRKGKNVFQFHGQEVRVVQQTIPQFAVFDFPPSEGQSLKNPLETFEWVSEAANWLKVPAQTVYAAVKRGKETKVKNKEGGVFWLKKLEEERVAPEEPQAPAPRKLSPKEPTPEKPAAPEKPTSKGPAPEKPTPVPQKNLSQEMGPWLQLSQNLPQILQFLQVCPELGQNLLLSLLQQGTSPEVLKQKLIAPPLKHEIPVEPPIPWAVADVLKGGNNHPFSPPHKLGWTLFVSPKNVAQFIRAGLQGRMVIQGSKTKKLMLWGDKLIYIPDLIKEIFVFYIRNQMFTDEKASKTLEQMLEDYSNMELSPDRKNWMSCYCLGSAKGLRKQFIYDVVKEFMKLIF